MGPGRLWPGPLGSLVGLVGVLTGCGPGPQAGPPVQPQTSDAPCVCEAPDPAVEPAGGLGGGTCAVPPHAPPELVEPQAGCQPKGAVPAGYAVAGLAPTGRLSLEGGWELRARAGDTEGALVNVPGFTPRAPRGRRAQVRLTRRFELPADASAAELSMDLGSRHGRTRVLLNGHDLGRAEDNAPFFRPAPLPLQAGSNELVVELDYPAFAGGVRWVGAPALGLGTLSRRGVLVQRYQSLVDGTSRELTLLVPACADLSRPLPLVVALPGWGGNIYSFVHSALTAECMRRRWLLLVPDPGGNRLYTDTAEDAVLEAIDLVCRELPVDRDRIYLTGASMGGAGALQIGYHYPDRFAALAAFYGDSRYDLRTPYIRRILRTRVRADRYSVLEFPANSRNLPVVLIHARDDALSPVQQSLALDAAHRRLGLPDHHLRAPPSGGHTLALVDRYAEEVLNFFGQRRRHARPTRVTFRSNSARYLRAYWAELELRQADRFGQLDLSLEQEPPALHVHRVDQGLRRGIADLDRAGVSLAQGLLVHVAQHMEAPLELRGANLPAALALQIAGDGRELGPLLVRGHTVSLGRLRAGSYRVVVGPGPQ